MFRSLGIHFIAVGVGRSNWRQLEQIVGNNELVFKATTFTDLLNMSDTISDAVCDEGKVPCPFAVIICLVGFKVPQLFSLA